MSLHRVRARVVYPSSSGLAVWSRDQMAVRYGQAVHIRPGEPSEEPPGNTAVDNGDGTSTFTCDLPLLDQSAAVDALATLTDASVWQQAITVEDEAGPVPSFVEHHTCDHDEDHRTGCVVVDRVETPVVTTDEWQAGVTYTAGDEVTYNGTLYRCLQGHTAQVGWEPPNVPALWEPVT